MYDPNTWKPMDRGGQRQPRPNYSAPPCHLCPKCYGSERPSPAVGRHSDLSEKNVRTLQLYYQHKAAPLANVDPIMQKNFGIIAALFDRLDRSRRRAVHTNLSALVARLSAPRPR